MPAVRPILQLHRLSIRHSLPPIRMASSAPMTSSTAPSTTVIEEGGARIAFDGPSKAFYNPVQEFNRDLTVTVLRAYSDQWHEIRSSPADQNFDGRGSAAKRRRMEQRKGLHVLEALSATGLRAIRFAKEVEGISHIIANDFSDAAVECIKRNVAANDVQHLVQASGDDANAVMFNHRKYDRRFDVVDIDPYGSPAHFVDAAVQCVDDDGLLMVTCTDVATLCGNHPEAAWMKYGAMPVRARACHEMALRIVLQCLDARANVYDRYIEPVLSLSIDFYLRIFVRLKSGAAVAKRSVAKRAHLYYCVGCETTVAQPVAGASEPGAKGGAKFVAAHAPVAPQRCDHCGSRMRIAGPFWWDRLHDFDFVARLINRLRADETKLGTHDRLLGMLTVVSEELPDAPLYHDVSGMCKSAKCPAMKISAFKSALLRAGFACSISHARPRGVKTNAPAKVVWDVVRCWALKKREENKDKEEGTVSDPISQRLMSQTPDFEADFTEHPDATPPSVVEGLLRFQDNKGKNWGPKTRTKGSVISTQAGMYNGSGDDAADSND